MGRIVPVWVALVAMVIGGCGSVESSSPSNDGGQSDVIVMAASSLAEVVETVAAEIPTITPVIAGSSTLVAQLQAGADADVLITADAQSMERAKTLGLINGDPAAIASNSLVLAVAAGNPGGVARLADLERSDLLIGLCAPEVPCGALAQRVLQTEGLAASVDTLESSVRALTAKLSLGELDAGLIYRTDAKAADLDMVETHELVGHLNHYLIAAKSSQPSPQVQAVIDVFTESDSVAARVLHELGFSSQ